MSLVLNQVDCQIRSESILAEWVLPMFVRILPWPSLVQIWDVSLFEGMLVDFSSCFFLLSSRLVG